MVTFSSSLASSSESESRGSRAPGFAPPAFDVAEVFPALRGPVVSEAFFFFKESRTSGFTPPAFDVAEVFPAFRGPASSGTFLFFSLPVLFKLGGFFTLAAEALKKLARSRAFASGVAASKAFLAFFLLYEGAIGDVMRGLAEEYMRLRRRTCLDQRLVASKVRAASPNISGSEHL